MLKIYLHFLRFFMKFENERGCFKLMIKKIKNLKLRYKLSLFILPQLAVFMLLYVYISNLLENEVLQRLTEHNRTLNHYNVTYTRNVLNEMKGFCDTTLRLDSPTISSEIEQLTGKLSRNENVHTAFSSTSRLWRLLLSSSSYIHRAAIVSYNGPAVYMGGDNRTASFVNFGFTFTDPDIYWMRGAIGRRGGYYISGEDGRLRVSREMICVTRLARLGVISVEAEIPFAASRFESNRLFANQQYGLFVNGRLSAGNAEFCIEEARAAIGTPSPYDFILFDRGSNTIVVYYRQTSPYEVISITKIPYDAIFMQAFQSIGGFVLIAALGIIGIGTTAVLAFIMREVYVREITGQKLELEMLRNQINPHFLYNTLETLRMNYLIGAGDKNAEMIEYLGDLLRYGVSSGGEPTLLSEEMRHLEYYVNLCNMRFGPIIQLQTDIRPILMQSTVIRLLFQPIAENAIIHGMRPGGVPLIIKITGTMERGRAYFLVTDNGVGITDERVREIEKGMNGQESKTMGIGLYNVHRRIRLLYGEEYGLSICPLPEGGTRVQITLPYKGLIQYKSA